jgi:outer membrane protein OmpA-like peptidoglycan-associated protein
VNLKKEQQMRRSKTPIQLSVLALVLALSSAVFGQDGNASSPSPGASSDTKVRTVGDGQKLKIEGIVVKRAADTFTLRAADGTETLVVLSDKTSVKTVRKGWFRRDRNSGVSYILRGLRLKAEGRGNADGQLVASDIRFDEDDLRTAQALESRVDPVETLAIATRGLAETNYMRIDEAEKRIAEDEQNAKRLSGQVDELSIVANAAGAAAENAQATADLAGQAAKIANNRINGLDDYEVFKTVTVHFKTGSAVLSAAAKTQIDEAAASVQNENLSGWIVAVVGYADSTGKSAKNRSLSERRANAVIRYLVTKYDLPMRRVVQPFGYGALSPVATNDTREGRSLNRRVEIRVLVNKGMSSQASSTTPYEDQSSRQH